MTNPPFAFDAPEDSPGFLLWQTTISWQRMIKKALEPHDISHAQFVIMSILLWWHGQKKEVTQIDIVTMSKLDKMTVSKSLKKLVGMNLVARHENQEDTRAKSVQLTKSGVALAGNLVPIVEGVDEDFFANLPKKQEKDLIVILQKLTVTEDVNKA
ncbi:MAG: MarR family winged helix-turn-helix transcriptional regulator [Chlamydiota bacterium]